MTGWADSRGIDRKSIETGMLAERLRILLEQIAHLESVLKEAEARVRSIEQQAEASIGDGGTPSAEIDEQTGSTSETISETRGVLARLTVERDDTRAHLKKLPGYGSELADCNSNELAEWSTMLLGEGEAAQKCKELLVLQERWLLRLGRSWDFHAAMLASANIVAGTCIGMAGVRGANAITYDLCIIDEASKATVTEILVPMARSRKWILVGDPEQLPPFFEEQAIQELDEFEDEEIRKTLLDRFLSTLPTACIEELRNQYRMVKPIGDLISQTFYGVT